MKAQLKQLTTKSLKKDIKESMLLHKRCCSVCYTTNSTFESDSKLTFPQMFNYHDKEKFINLENKKNLDNIIKSVLYDNNDDSDSEASSCQSSFYDKENVENYCISEKILQDYEKEINLTIIKKISDLIQDKIDKNKQLPSSVQNKCILPPFTHKTLPKISFYSYMLRILHYTSMEKSTLVISYVYFLRFLDSLYKNFFIILENNVFRLFFGCILLALKYNEDEIQTFSYFSKVAGISTKELKAIELSLLDYIDFDLIVDKEVFFNTYNMLNKTDI